MPTPKTDGWTLRRTPKYSDEGVARVVPPDETIRRVRALMSTIGVTRIGDVTHLDRIGIPNALAVRPRDMEPGISYYNGKGVSQIDAEAGAMMEAIERYSGERCDLPVFYGTFGAANRRGAAIDPDEIFVPRVRKLSRPPAIEWVVGRDLVGQRPVHVPLNSVVCPYLPSRGGPLYYASTNGLASGNVREEALCHALCEVIERDSEALAVAALSLTPAVQHVLARANLRSSAADGAARRRFPLIALDTLPARAAGLARKLLTAGLTVYLRNITGSLGVPTIDCTIVDRPAGGPVLVHGGCGTHPDARVAVVRALTEAAQSRVATIQGGREDLPDILRAPDETDPDALWGGGAVQDFRDVPTFSHARVDQDVDFLLGRLRGAGLHPVVAVDLTRPELGIPVMRVVIPRTEAWTIFHLHTGRGTFGARVGAILRGEACARR